MKNIVSIIILISIFSCKQTKENDIDKKTVNTADGIAINKNALLDCTDGIFFNNEIPTFNYEIIFPKKKYSIPFLIDTIFTNFYKNKIETNIDKSLKGERIYIEFSKYYLSDKKDLLTKKENVFGFNTFNGKSGTLEYAELNYPTKYYKNVKRNWFKIKKDSFLIDIGMDKAQFAKIFDKDVKSLCDTISVADDSNTSYYIFKDSKLNKVIFNFYTP